MSITEDGGLTLTRVVQVEGRLDESAFKHEGQTIKFEVEGFAEDPPCSKRLLLALVITHQDAMPVQRPCHLAIRKGISFSRSVSPNRQKHI